MTPLRKLLKDNKKCNPFNDAFDYDQMWELVKQNIPIKEFEEDPLRYTPAVTHLMNSFFKDFFELIKENLATSNLTHKDFVELLIVLFNRNYLVVLKKQIALMKTQKQIHQNDLYKLKLTTLNEGMGPVELNSSLEVETDALTYVLNYTRYFATTSVAINNSLPELHPIQAGQIIFMSSSYYTIMKSTYDDSIWTYGHWITKSHSSKVLLHVDYPDSDLLVSNKVGLIRLQKNTTTSIMQMIPHIINKTPLGQLISNVARSRKKPKQLASITIERGYIKPELVDGISEKQDILEIKNVIELDTFYAFLNNPPLKSLNGLQLMDLIKLFSLVQHICKAAAFVEFDDSIFKHSDIEKFPIKFHRAVLLGFLQQSTDYSTVQIETFVDLISARYGDRMNLWDRPIIKDDENLYINYLSTLNPLLLNIVDHWLDQGGFSFDERGNLLEDYLTTVISTALQEKGFEGKMPSSSKIYNKLKQFEEIDLIVNLKDVVVIGEVKCIKYPYECRDHHNAMNRLKEAAEQVKRKTKFLKEHENDVKSQTGAIAGKSFLPVIITNYPIYSTFKVDGVIITDFYLLEGYFSEGAFTEGRTNNKGISEIVKRYAYYSNEKEMNENLATYLEKPPPVETLKQMFEVRPFKVSMDDLDYEIYVTSAQTKLDPELIISHKGEER